MRAHATAVAESDGAGRTRCTTLRSSPPLTLRETPEGFYVVGSAAGPLGGDDLCLDMTLAEGATLAVRSVAAQMVLPGPSPGPSWMHVVVNVGEGATLSWLPEPMILAGRADHRSTIVIQLAATAQLVWREEIVSGRDGEAGGSLWQRLRIDRGGRPLFRNDLALGPYWPGSDGPAGTGGARVVGTLLVVGPAATRVKELDDHPDVRAARCQLADEAVVVQALGESREAVHQLLVTACPT